MAILLACATQPAPLSAAACPTTTIDRIETSFRVGGIEPTARLGEADTLKLRAWLVETYGATIQENVDATLIYATGDRAMLLWFYLTCFQGHSEGPWAPVQEHLGL